MDRILLTVFYVVIFSIIIYGTWKPRPYISNWKSYRYAKYTDNFNKPIMKYGTESIVLDGCPDKGK